MSRFVKLAFSIWAAVLLLVVGLAMAQSQPAQGIKRTEVQPTSPASGQEMFQSYCAACHGKEGRGNGPAASQLKQPPADLTTLAKRHGGKFPDEYVANVLRFGTKSPTHGSSDMPVWGPLFSSVSNRDKQQVEMRIYNLTAYIKSLQSK